VDWYTTKRQLLRPLTAWRRRRAARLGPINPAVFEAFDYRPAMFRFYKASHANREILFDVDLPEGAVVLDVGAYEGNWSKRVLERAAAKGPSDLRIHAFEPAPGAIDVYRAAVGGDPHVELHAYGLSGRDRVERMALAGLGSSIYVDPSAPKSLGSAEVEFRDVDAVLTSLAVDQVDLVKINIEGGEYELLDRLHETGWLARTRCVIVQFHEFAPDAYRGRRRNRRQLSETHRCTWRFGWVYERWDPR
jgi:FkbM family methyltransferase